MSQMNATMNKQLMQDIFSALSTGDDQPFIDAMASDMKWIWMGSGQWEKIFDGKKSILDELWTAVKQTLVPPYMVKAERFITDGDYVVVEAVGQNTTPDGRKYHNKYCWVCCIRAGQIHELREYMDTDLVTKTFGQGNTTG
jgi:uncharacterized protein